MRAVRNTVRGIEVVQVARPAAEGIRVRPRSIGICGSDLHLIAHNHSTPTLGHEFAGVLDDGVPVAVNPRNPCWQCDQCTAGYINRCRDMALRSRGTGIDGGMADEIYVPEASLVRLAPNIPVEDACLIEPLAVAIHGFNRARLESGMRIAVVGGGGVGLMAVVAARSVGCDVGLISRYAHQAAAGERLGARPAAGTYDLVVEATGSESATATAVELARPGATVLMLGTCHGTIPIPGLPALGKELQLVWALTYGYGDSVGGTEFADAAALMARTPDIAAIMITHRFSMDEAADAFRVAADKRSGAIKVVINP